MSTIKLVKTTFVKPEATILASFIAQTKQFNTTVVEVYIQQ